MHALDVIDKIARGDVYKRLLTFREGLTIAEMAQVFEERGFGTAADFQKAAANAQLIADLDPAARDLEGYLFPETYSLPRRTPASDVVAQMVTGFRNALSPETAHCRGCRGPERAPARHAGVARRKGNRRGRRAAARRRRLSQSHEDSAWGCRPIPR